MVIDTSSFQKRIFFILSVSVYLLLPQSTQWYYKFQLGIHNFSLESIKVMNNNIDFSYTLSKAHLTRQIDQIKLKIINF